MFNIDLETLFKKKQDPEKELITLMINSILIEVLENHIDRIDVVYQKQTDWKFI